MDIETLAAWGELIGGVGGMIAAVAVVASLLFVGIQIRASVRQANVDSYSTITSLWTGFTNTVAASEETWAVFYQGIRDYDSLSAPEKARFNFLIGMYYGIQDTVMVHEDLGVWNNPETYHRLLDESYRMFRSPGVQSWWQQHQGRVFAPRVEKYLVDRLRAESGER
ncbi:hypothetical protein DWB85_10925 [Seongchinamella sediminis]|uniref:DUF4760 domain-containing protein n=1 Tax=Seongchinamella sediminis TaxID=2283635 RepID=A0A3L7E0Z4_9GAMM|nr:hypothetical protein [Seongchinamella sediminis]RLQ21792.1 hypothetical protein DWB85_10925 [Seongchinamella sediminis]